MISRRPFLFTFFILQCLSAFTPVASVQDGNELPSSASSRNNLRQPLHLQPQGTTLEANDDEDMMLVEERPRRKLLDFWSFLMLIHPPCPPPDAPHQPHHCRSHGSGGGSGSGGSGSGGGSGGSSSGSGSGSSSSSSSVNAASSSSYYDSGGSSSSSSSAAAANSANYNQSAEDQSSFFGLGWYAIPIGLSLFTTAYAVAVGSRRKPQKHNLTGALSRRVIATDAYAERAMPMAAGGVDARLM